MKAYETFRHEFPQTVEHELLSAHSTYHIGGPADLFLIVRSSEKLSQAILRARNLEIPVTVIGGGSNILVKDQGIRGLVIKNLASKITVRGMKGKITKGKMEKSVAVHAECGCMINSLVRYTIDEGLSGLEWHLGLPGTVGGALYMNSKWTKGSVHYVGDVLQEATILTPDLETRTVNRSYFRFGYDQSILQTSGDIVLTAEFLLTEEEKEILWKRAQESIMFRKDSQPMGISTAGCTFRNISILEARTAHVPDHITSAGYLIDSVGLKGVTAGGAQISNVHANFIINTGGASASDVLQLIDRMKSTVRSRYGITLHEEIVILGE